MIILVITNNLKDEAVIMDDSGCIITMTALTHDMKYRFQ